MNDTNERDPNATGTETVLDEAVRAVLDEPVNEGILEAARTRVWNRLTAQAHHAATSQENNAMSEDRTIENKAETASSTNSVPGVASIQGCAGFRELLPALVQGALNDSRRILVEDHTRECVTCRRALQDLRLGRSGDRQRAGSGTRRRASMWSRSGRRAALAAGVTALLAVGGWAASGWVLPEAGGTGIEVESIAGGLSLSGGDRDGDATISAGDRLHTGDVVRTSSGSGAVLRLSDGSRVELAERSEVRLERRRGGMGLGLTRGSLIVDAAHGSSGSGPRLIVQTADFEASVRGTVTAVRQGSKGARISVLQGEAQLDRVRTTRASGVAPAVLRSGDQFASRADLARVPLDRDIAWSREAVRYRREIAALRAVGREIDVALSAPARRSSRLLDLVPASTGAYIAVPNVASSLGEAWDRLQQQIADNPALARWWSERASGEELEHLETLFAELRDLGAELGDELVVTLEARNTSPVTTGGVLALAEVARPDVFSARLDETIARWNERANNDAPDSAPKLRRVEAPPTGGVTGDLFVWLDGDLLLISPDPAQLAEAAAAHATGASAFRGTDFHTRLATVYEDGAGWVAGLDVQALSAADTPAEVQSSGLEALAYVILNAVVEEDATGTGSATTSRALLAFDGPRERVAAWLAQPAPLRAIDFISPDAHLATAALLVDPVAMFDDVFALATAENPDAAGKLADFEREVGFDLRGDLAASLGGDVAFAIDGPWLPQPAWKLAVEVVDPNRLQQTIEAAVAAANRQATTQGQTRRIELTQETHGGRVLYRLAARNEDGTAARAAAHYLIEDGFFLAGPNPTLLLEAIAQRTAGVTLASSSRFRDLLPRDGEVHFSAVAYQNLGAVAESLGSWLSAHPSVSGDQRQQLLALASEGGAGLAVAYGGVDDITIAARTTHGPLGLSMERLMAFAGTLSSSTSHGETGSAEAPAGGTPRELARNRQRASA